MEGFTVKGCAEAKGRERRRWRRGGRGGRRARRREVEGGRGKREEGGFQWICAGGGETPLQDHQERFIPPQVWQDLAGDRLALALLSLFVPPSLFFSSDAVADLP
eukprot:543194-Hanusia_phi.AAC.1